VSYPYKVWLFTIILSPVFLFIRLWSFLSENNTETTQAVAFLGLAIFFGAAFSLPALFLFKLLYKDLRYSSLNEWLQKFIFTFIGGVLIWVTFFLVNRKFVIGSEFNNIIWPVAYSVCLSVGALLFDAKQSSKSSSNYATTKKSL